jgi:hypothetical protein
MLLSLLLLVRHICTASTQVSTSRMLPTTTRTMTTMQSVVVPKNDAEGITNTSTPKNEYADYLKLDQLLPALQPRTGARDETLFIVQRQISNCG